MNQALNRKIRARWPPKPVSTFGYRALAFAGIVVLTGLALSVIAHPAWIWLSVFAGANMVQAAFTRFCPAALVFRRLGLKPGAVFS